MTFQPKADHKRTRWLALFGVLLLMSGFTVAPALAAPTFTFVEDDAGPNDEPGQKDLTAQSTDFDNGLFYSAWKWDDISWSGNNTGDACSLFDTDGNGFVDYAVCATIGKPAVEKSTRVYSCGDTRADRCTNPIELLGTESADSTADWCAISSTGAQFPTASNTTDTLAVCNISQIADDLDLESSGLVGANLLNTCSYPSQEPNSDPSDCVVTEPAQPTTTTTLPSGSATFTATLNDSATVSNNGQGTVAFKLWSDAACTVQVGTTATVNTNASGVATTSTTVSTAGTYYWTADFTPTDPGEFDPSSSACLAEVVNVTAPSVTVVAPTPTPSPTPTP
jgi:hypothetical protein